MFNRSGVLAAIAAGFIAGAAHAESLQPIEAKDIDLGTMTGIVYYTVEANAFRVVATLQTASEDPTPVRFIATLAPGQGITLSTPRRVGEPAVEVRFVRLGDRVFVDRGGQVAEAVRMPDGPKRDGLN